MRRLIAGGAAVLLVILLFIAIKGCLGSRKDSAYRSYATDVNELLASSNAESKALFQTLSTPPKGGTGGDSLDVQNIVNTQTQDAQDLVNRAKDLDHPDELDAGERLAGADAAVPRRRARPDRQSAAGGARRQGHQGWRSTRSPHRSRRC